MHPFVLSLRDVIEGERRLRIRVSLFAYAYEVMNDPLVSDDEYDRLSLQINPETSTGNPLLDAFFANEFDACTGQWVWRHPDIAGLARVYKILTKRDPIIPAPYRNSAPPVTMDVSKAGFASHTEMKWYLASLGFSVVPDVAVYGGRMYETVYDNDCAHITDCDTRKSVTIFYNELFR